MDVFDEIKPEQPAGDVFDQIKPEPPKPAEHISGFGVSGYEKGALATVASGGLKSLAALERSLHGMAKLTGELLGKDTSGKEWDDTDLVKAADLMDKTAVHLDEYAKERGVSGVGAIPGEVVGGLPVGFVEWGKKVPGTLYAGLDAAAKARAEGKGIWDTATAGAVGAGKRLVMGKLLDRYSEIKNAVLRRGAGAATFAADTAASGGDLTQTLTSGTVGALMTGKKPERPVAVRPVEAPVKPPEVTIQPPEPPVVKGNADNRMTVDVMKQNVDRYGMETLQSGYKNWLASPEGIAAKAELGLPEGHKFEQPALWEQYNRGLPTIPSEEIKTTEPLPTKPLALTDEKGNTFSIGEQTPDFITLDINGKPVKVGAEWAGMFKEAGKFTDNSVRGIAKSLLDNSPGLGKSNSVSVNSDIVANQTETRLGEIDPAKLAKTYAEAATGKTNPYVRKSTIAKTNKGRVLTVQFSSDLLTQGAEDPAARAYYDKLYSTRPGYNKLQDFWEIPAWIGQVHKQFSGKSDMYVVRNMDEARQFLKTSGYDRIAFSALDVNKDLIRQLAKEFPGKVIVGGYNITPETFKGNPNVKTYESIEAMARGEGVAFKEGSDLSAFKDSKVIPRLGLSKGCKGNCTFCTVPKGLTEASKPLIRKAAIEIGKNLKSDFVYLDDKTFGQAKNFEDIKLAKDEILKYNPNFKGFIVQTTAAQFNKFDPKFLGESGIKYVELGIESYNDPILKSLKKPATETIIDKAMDRARQEKMAVIPNVMVGLPGETAETYQRTLDFLKKNSDVISHVNIYNLALYEGTELRKLVEVKDKSDLNENMVAKSFHKNPQDHVDFANKVYAMASEFLDKPSLAEVFPEKAIQETGGKQEIKVYQGSNEERTNYFSTDKNFAKDYGNVKEYTIAPEKVFDSSNENNLNDLIKIVGPLEDPYTGKAYKTAKGFLKAVNGGNDTWEGIEKHIDSIEGMGYDAIKIYEGGIANYYSPTAAQSPPQKPPTVPPVAAPGAPEPPPKPEKPKIKGMSRSQALRLGHSIPNVLGWDAAKRMDFMRNLVGKTSMKDMDLAEARLVVEGMQAEAKRLGFELEGPSKTVGIADDLITTLQTTKPKITEIEEYNAPAWRKFVHGFKKLLFSRPSEILGMPQRFFGALDGRKPDGPFQRLIYKPLVEKSSLARLNAHAEQTELAQYINDMPGQKLVDLWKPQKIEGTRHKLTASEKLGVYGLSQNETGLKRLLNAGFTPEDISAIHKSVTGSEKALYEFIMGKFESQWKPLVNSAVQAGWDIGDLKKEFRYVPIEDANPGRGQKDFVDQLVEFAAGNPMSPESRMLLLRVPGARGKINLDLIQLYMNNAIRVQRFIQMAPLAKQLRGIAANRGVMDELNRRTYGQGSRIMGDFISDKIRGGPVRENTPIERIFALLRTKATAFAAGRNILMTMRQPLAYFTTMADDPHLIPYVVKNAASIATPGGSHRLSEFVNQHSLFMADRDVGREVRKIYNQKTLIRTLKNQLSHKSVNWYNAADKNVANAAWKSYYDYSMDKLSVGNEADAMAYADSRIKKTQSLIHKEDLPALYRGGELSQSISVFTRELATLGNYWVHDVYGAKVRGDIGWGNFGYKVMMSQIIPALIFGAIARGGKPPKDLKQLATDLGTYSVAPSIFLGGIVNRLVTGMDSGMIALSGWEGIYGIIQQARKLPDWDEKTDDEKAMIIRQLIKKSAITFGAFTGKISAQDIRSIEGAYDLWMGNTQDPRRLIWSDYGLNKGQEPAPQEGR